MNIFARALVLVICISSSTALSPALLLSPLIANNKTQQAKSVSSVDPKLFLNVSSHAGFLTVDEKYNSNTFFWYFPVAGKPVNETPLIVWLQGGPGASSLAGLFDEIGPFEYKNTELKLREWSWTKQYSVLFVDNPVGAGYSFTNDSRGYVTDMETCSTYLYSALTQFLQIFPELRKAPLYIAGESYAGRYLPALGVKIFEENKKHAAIGMNLQGLMMSNPVISPEKNQDLSSQFYQWGLIDVQGKLAVKPLQDAYAQAVQNNEPQKAADLREKLLSSLRNMAMLLHNDHYNILKNNINLDGFVEFLRREDIKEAIHVGDMKFAFTNGSTYTKLINDSLIDITTQVTKLLDHYRILVYCGQLDIMAPCVPNSEERREKWTWSLRDYFMNAPRTPWWYNESVVGYVKDGGGLTEVLVKDAGHMVPMDKPAATLQLISHFIKGISLPMPSNYDPSVNDTPIYDNNDNKVQPIVIQNSDKSYHNVMIASVVINVVLVAVIVAGALYMFKWKRRTAAMFYSSVDDTSTSLSNSMLTIT